MVALGGASSRTTSPAPGGAGGPIRSSSISSTSQTTPRKWKAYKKPADDEPLWPCQICKRDVKDSGFSYSQRGKAVDKRSCLECVDYKWQLDNTFKCYHCNEKKYRGSFSKRAIRVAGDRPTELLCTKCQGEVDRVNGVKRVDRHERDVDLAFDRAIFVEDISEDFFAISDKDDDLKPDADIEPKYELKSEHDDSPGFFKISSAQSMGGHSLVSRELEHDRKRFAGSVPSNVTTSLEDGTPPPRQVVAHYYDQLDEWDNFDN